MSVTLKSEPEPGSGASPGREAFRRWGGATREGRSLPIQIVKLKEVEFEIAMKLSDVTNMVA